MRRCVFKGLLQPSVLAVIAFLPACQTGYLGGGDEYKVPFRAELLASSVSGRPGEMVELPFRILPLYSGPDLIACTWITSLNDLPPPQITESTSGLACVRFSGLGPADTKRPLEVAPQASPGAWPLVLHVANEASRHSLRFTLEVRP